MFKIAYCDPLDPEKMEYYKTVCQNFVTAIENHLPEWKTKLKVHLVLHLPDDMLVWPTAAFNTERYNEHIFCTFKLYNSLLSVVRVLTLLFEHGTSLVTDMHLVKTLPTTLQCKRAYGLRFQEVTTIHLKGICSLLLCYVL